MMILLGDSLIIAEGVLEPLLCKLIMTHTGLWFIMLCPISFGRWSLLAETGRKISKIPSFREAKYKLQGPKKKMEWKKEEHEKVIESAEFESIRSRYKYRQGWVL
jgi:hypothetical protein